MNYIREIVAFHDSLLYNQLSTGQIALWHALMCINNKAGWTEWFNAANNVLETQTGLTRRAIVNARNVLKQKGYLDFKQRGTKATAYKMVSLTMVNTSQETSRDTSRQTSRETSQETSQETSTLIKRNKNKPISICVPFDTFWSAYPRKVGKLKAEQAWTRIAPDEELAAEIIKSVELHKKTEGWRKDGGAFVPHPATFLNGRRWEDEVEPHQEETRYLNEEEGWNEL